jgi:hypothetical protein
MTTNTVEKINVFDHDILKLKIPSEFYQSLYLKQDINDLFDSNLILTKGLFSREQRGVAYSSCPIGDNSLVTQLTDVSQLINHITELVANQFYNDPDKQIVYPRIWVNKMFKNCSGICHTHQTPGIDGVCVFYYNVPENGSKFIVLKKNINGEVTEDHKDISHYIQVKTGDALIHKNTVPHAVSEHMNDDPRICFVFEFGTK